MIMKASLKIFLFAVAIVLFYEGVTRGYKLGYDLFYGEAVEAAPGRDITVTIPEGASAAEVAEILEEKDLTGEALWAKVQGILADPDRLRSLGENAGKMEILDANDRIYRVIKAAAGK